MRVGSWGLMWKEDSSTLPEQKEDRGIEISLSL